MFLDPATHMPLMMTDRRPGSAWRARPARRRRRTRPRGPRAARRRRTTRPRRGGGPPQPITIETHLSEYKAVNGIKLPHLITRGVNGQTNEEWEIKNYRINPNLKANTFTK